MTKLLFLTNSIDGIYTFRKELVLRLRDQGYEVILAGPKGFKESYFRDLGCTCLETAMHRRGKNPFEDLALFWHYREILRSEQPDLVLTYTIKPNIYGGMAARSLRIPYMANITGLGTAMENQNVLQRLALALYKISFRKADCVFFQNEENLSFFKEKKLLHGPARLVAGSGVNLEKYRVLDYGKGEQLNFIFISRVMKEKGIEEYLSAAEAIRKNHPETVFHILGFCEGDYLGRVKEMEGRGIIRYHGYQENMHPFYALSHCTVHPTFYPEGMSNVLLESAACGRPVITTNRSGCREVVDEGVNGFFVEKQDAKDLIRVLERFIALPYTQRKAMGLAGRAKVEKTFDREKVLQAYMDEIRRIMSRKEQASEREAVSIKAPHNPLQAHTASSRRDEAYRQKEVER